jgi:TolB protein
MRRAALSLVLAAAGLACAGQPAPSDCGADGLPLDAAPDAGCAPGPGWIGFAFTPQGGQSPALFVTRPDGTCRRRVTSDGAFHGPPAFFPGGRRLAYASTRSGLNQLYLLDLETGAESRLETRYAFGSPPGAPVDLGAAAPAVSPDGATIAFEGSLAAYPGWSDVFTVPATGGPVARVTRDPAAASLPRWSGDGSLLYFVSYRTGTAELFAVGPDGAAEAQVTRGSALASRYTLSGDGRALVYARFGGAGTGSQPTELVAQDLASGAIRVISSANEADPAVDAGDTSVAVSRRSPTGYDLYLLDAASGATRRQLTACPGQAFGAAWAR